MGKREGRREEALKILPALAAERFKQTRSPENASVLITASRVISAWCSEFSDCRVPHARFVHHLCGEQLAKQPLRLAQSLLGEHDRLGFAERVSDVAFLVQSMHRIPVKSLPSAAFVVPAEI